jgi:hypothetical protein
MHCVPGAFKGLLDHMGVDTGAMPPVATLPEHHVLGVVPDIHLRLGENHLKQAERKLAIDAGGVESRVSQVRMSEQNFSADDSATPTSMG